MKPIAYMHKWPNGKTAFTATEKPPGGFDGWATVTTPLYAEPQGDALDSDLLTRLEALIRKYEGATLELNTGFGSDYIPIELIGTNLRDVLSAILSGRENGHVSAALASGGDVGIRHGVNCQKINHALGGYLHDEKDDTPYDVDGVGYCGRCHRVMPENGNV